MRPDHVGLGGFDSHALPPRARALVIACIFALPGAGTAAAQAAASATVPPISPKRALLTSLVVPGLAQARLDRPLGILFMTAEALGLTMYVKSGRDLTAAKSFARDSAPSAYTVDPNTGQPVLDSLGAPIVSGWSETRLDARVRARKTHVEDWVAFLIFNHLFAGIDAFVAAQLWELPAQVQVRVAPGVTRVRASFAW